MRIVLFLILAVLLCESCLSAVLKDDGLKNNGRRLRLDNLFNEQYQKQGKIPDNSRTFYIKGFEQYVNTFGFDLNDINFALSGVNDLYVLINDDIGIHHVERLFKENPQLRKLGLDFLRNDILKILNSANTFLPNLVTLSIMPGHPLDTEEDASFGTIKFEQLKNLKVLKPNFSLVSKLLCPKLESIELIFNTTQSDNYIRFAENHPHVKRLHVSSRDENVLQFIKHFPDLEEVTIHNFVSISAPKIDKFISSHEKLTKFQFAFMQFENEDEEFLKKFFEKEWQIQKYEVPIHTLRLSGLSFERIRQD